jgi:predicted ATPase
LIARLIGGRYELLELLGSGGMGEVYRALDRLVGETVALKSVKSRRASPSVTQLQPSRGSSEAPTSAVLTLEMTAAKPTDVISPLERTNMALASEFRVLSALRHPNIVSVLDYGFDEKKVPYFTMKLLPSAVTIVDASRSRALSGKLDLLFQMLEALSYLHRHGVIHRDLKPSNVLVAGDRVTVLDFGLSGMPTEAWMGTPGYIAPETIGGGMASPLSDLYAVGVIAFETLSGQQPYPGGWRPGAHPDVAALSGHEKLRGVVEQLLAPAPSQRPENASHAIAALADAAGISTPSEPVEHRESYLKAAPFMGRGREVARLNKALQEALDGKGSGWLLGGESGVGKSRVLAELRSAALVQGAIVLDGRPGTGVPYSTFRDPVLRLALLSKLPDEDASVLKAAFPDLERVLARQVPDAPIDPETFRERLANAVLGLVQRCPSKMVIELEDCQLLAESLHLVKTLLDHAHRLPLLLLAAYRDNERPRFPQELPAANVLRLAPFDEQGIREIVSAMLGPELGRDDTLVQFLARETEGNAFFLVEAVRTLAEASGRLDRISPANLPAHLFTREMMEVVWRRLDSLPDWTEHPLRIAAALGRDVEVPAIRAACPNCNMDLFLLECSEARVLEGHGYRWRFRHDKLREGVIARLETERNLSIYAEAAAAIEKLYGESPAWVNIQARCWKKAGVTDKAVHYLLMSSSQCLQTGAPERAVDLALQAVAELGVEIPGDAAGQGQAVGVELQRISGLLAGRVPADLMHLPLLKDSRVGQIIDILAQLAPGAHINQRRELFALSVLKCMALTLEHGVGPGASFAFGTYALLIRNLTGDAHLAHSFGRLGIDTDVRLRGRAGASAQFIHYWFLNHWIHPIETNLEPTLNSAAVGFEDRDILYGCISAAAYVMYLQATGAELDRVVQTADVQLARIAGRVSMAVFQSVLERQMAQALTGRTTGRFTFTDAVYDEERDLKYIVRTSNYTQAAYYYRSKLQLHYLYRDYAGAMEWAEKGIAVLSSIEGQVGEWQFGFFHALAAAARAGQVEGEAREVLLRSARDLLEKFGKWTTRCEANFGHRTLLIDAEIQRVSGDRDSSAAFERAVAAAEAHRWVHDIALAHELAAACCREAGEAEAAREHATLAARSYERWGAHAKARDVRSYAGLEEDTGGDAV